MRVGNDRGVEATRPVPRHVRGTVPGNRAETTTWETEHAETHFPGGLGRDPGLARGGAGGEQASTEIHPAVGPGDSRSGVDHGLRDAQPRLHGVRHAVRADRQGVRLQGHAADGRRPRHRERRQDLEADPARRPAVPQRRAGAGERLRRLHQALGRARCVRPGADGAHRRTLRAGRQDHPVSPETTVRTAARRARPRRLQHVRHHAEAHRGHRSVQAVHRGCRLRSVPLQGGRTRAGIAVRLRALRQVQAARGWRGQLHRRTEDRAFRPGRVARAAGLRHQGRGDAGGRTGLVGEPAGRSAAAAQEGQDHRRDHRLHRDAVPAAAEPSVSAVRQSGGAPRADGRDRPEAVHDRDAGRGHLALGGGRRASSRRSRRSRAMPAWRR